jgi:uncharacterized protein (DUF433 family)
MGELAGRFEKVMATLHGKKFADVSTLDWSVAIDHVIFVNVRRFAEAAAKRAAALEKAEGLVTSDDQIMGGEPVFAGTRVPVRTVASWVASGEPPEAIRKSFPTLSDEMIEAAPLWARTHPQRGRPKSFRELNPDWKIVSSKRVKLGGQ